MENLKLFIITNIVISLRIICLPTVNGYLQPTRVGRYISHNE